MATVYTRPGIEIANDPVLEQAYGEQDKAMAAWFRSIIEELDQFTRANKSQPILGFDASRYLPLERDARVAMSDLTRSLQRWES